MNRFALQWLVPARADRFTHVMVLDRDRPAPYVSDAGHGADRARALLNLWETLVESDAAAAETIDFVAVEYMRRTGAMPRKSRHSRDLR
jgi:hypothetical protein